jgi:adenosylcobinamide-GDP ribazoletransferase
LSAVPQPGPLRRFRIAVAFLTRLPTGRLEVAPGELGAATAAFPAVGVLLGVLGAATLSVLASILPVAVAAPGAVALLATLTGGIHLDGLADSFDAIGAGGDRARRLEVMRDSRIGAHGAAAVALALLVKSACLEPLAAAGPVALVSALATARALVVIAIRIHPYARSEGLGRPFASVDGTSLAIACATALVVAIALPAPGGLLAVAFAAAVSLSWWAWLARSLGGLTGDTYGAGIELAEIAFLCAAAAAC